MRILKAATCPRCRERVNQQRVWGRLVRCMECGTLYNVPEARS